MDSELRINHDLMCPSFETYTFSSEPLTIERFAINGFPLKCGCLADQPSQFDCESSAKLMFGCLASNAIEVDPSRKALYFCCSDSAETRIMRIRIDRDCFECEEIARFPRDNGLRPRYIPFSSDAGVFASASIEVLNTNSTGRQQLESPAVSFVLVDAFKPSGNEDVSVVLVYLADLNDKNRRRIIVRVARPDSYDLFEGEAVPEYVRLLPDRRLCVLATCSFVDGGSSGEDGAREEDKRALGLDGRPVYNSGDLEECDYDGQNQILQVIGIERRELLVNVNLAPSSFLFPCFGRCSFCLRHDVDGIVWTASSSDVLTHTQTLNAFGYVLASKKHRFVCFERLSERAAALSAVFDWSSNHLFIYTHGPSDRSSHRLTKLPVQSAEAMTLVGGSVWVLATLTSGQIELLRIRTTTAVMTRATSANAKTTNGSAGLTSNPQKSPQNVLYVVKRDSRRQNIMFDKITSRISKLCYGLNMEYVDPTSITLKVIAGLYPGVTTVELDNLAAETAATMTVRHPDYAVLAARIAVSNLHKETKKSFSEVIANLHESGLISPETASVVHQNSDFLDSAIVHDRDFSYNYFGFKTLERSYLLKIGGRVVERPQHLLMRVAVGIHGADLDSVLNTYELMSQKWFTHATPTLFNAGTVNAQLSSCFLLTMVEDSISGIYETLKRCALISKSAGGIGLSVSNIRAKGTHIAGTNGFSNGIIPMLRVFDATARYVDQGGNKRPGAFAVYLEPWHPDVFEFVDMRKNRGAEELRGRDLFYALWVPDLFMKRIEKNEDWTLMCPHECPGLDDCWGDQFEKLYERYEAENRGKRKVPARQLWYAIVEAQIETGNPFMVYKDACNSKSNHQHLGTIKSSNLCTEIVEFSSPDEVAVCNLASIALNKFVVQQGPLKFDFAKLAEVVGVVVRNLNRVIDLNYYPIEETRKSNLRHRPIGLGVQGLADTFVLLRFPFDCDRARVLNRQIFETIYYAAVRASCDLAKQQGAYESFRGSPMSRGQFQFDMWKVKPSDRYDWESLRKDVVEHGVRNSLLIAPMPTASTAQILGNNESIEPYTSNIYSRRVLSGEFQVVNPHLLGDLIERGLWSDELRQQLMNSNGSIQHIPTIPDDLKQLYRTVWEISQRAIIDMAADRGAYIDQSQSLNLHMAEPTYAKISSMHFYGWKKGLKTGMYYLRSKPASDPIKFTLDKAVLAEQLNGCSIKENGGGAGCFMCSA